MSTSIVGDEAALVKCFADFADEIAGRIGLLQDGQALALDFVELGDFCAVAGWRK